MFTHSTLARGFPAHCKRCGGVLNEPVAFCIHCGIAHPLDADFKAGVVPPITPSAPAAPSAPVDTAADATGNVTPAVLQASNFTVSPGSAAPLIHRPLVSTGRLRSLRVQGAVLFVILTLAYGVFWLWMELRSSSNGRAKDTARIATGVVALYAPKQLINALADVGSGSNTGASSDATNLSKPVAVPHVRELDDRLGAARAGLAAHDLSGARAALDAALKMQPDSADVHRMQSDLASLESRRDAALRTARSCVKDGMWDCVRVGASDALAIDAGSTEAQALLQRAIVESGWVPLPRHVPQTAAPPRPTKKAKHVRPTKTAKPVDSAVDSNDGDDAGDAETRAIVESGWKSPPDNAASAPASDATEH